MSLNPILQAMLEELQRKHPAGAKTADVGGMALDPSVATAPAVGGAAAPGLGAQAEQMAGQVAAVAAQQPKKVDQNTFMLLMLKIAKDTNDLVRQIAEAAGIEPSDQPVTPDDLAAATGLGDLVAPPGAGAAAAGAPAMPAADPAQAAGPAAGAVPGPPPESAKVAGYDGSASGRAEPQTPIVSALRRLAAARSVVVSQ